MEKISITSYTLPQLTQYLKEAGQPGFRAKQIYQWLHEKRVSNFDDMTNIPKNFTQFLKENCTIERHTIRRKQESKDGTVKYLMEMADGNCIETVVMRYGYGNTACVSTQVGCRMGCKFCASTQAGLIRNLTAGEICSQIYVAQEDINDRISNIVLMGIGEPLDNFDNVMDFLTIISSDEGINIGMRNISLSTCGLVDGIHALAEKKLGITLAISLHGPTDEIRSAMMPINNKYQIKQLISACKAYQSITSRRISFEYAMVKGVNDTDDCVLKLSKLLRGMGAHVNLIPINPVDGSDFSATDAENVNAFKQKLEALGINATVRRRLGTDISAACGQLRREETMKRD